MPGVEPKSWESSRTELELGGALGVECLAAWRCADRVFLQLVGFIEQRERIGHDDDHLAFAMGAEALLAGVLVFDFERVPIGAIDLNSHARPASPNRQQPTKARELWLECGYSESGGRVRPMLSVPAGCLSLCLPQALFPQRERIVRIKYELNSKNNARQIKRSRILRSRVRRLDGP